MGNDFAAMLTARNVSSALTDVDSSMLMPEDVRLEILSRLPVKSLMRLRCVCKSCYQVYDDAGHDNLTCLFKDKTLADISYENIHRPILRTLLGPYDDHTSGDYKVVFICELWNEQIEAPYEHSLVAIYTSTTDSWRVSKGNVEWIPYDFKSHFKSTNLNGVFYWLVSRDDGDHSNIMLSFHISDEEFREIERPRIPYSSHESLGLFNNSVSLLHFDKSSHYIDIWLMSDMNWIQQFAIGPFLGVMSPRGIWKNNAVLMESDNGTLLLYDLIVEEVRDLGRFTRGTLGTAILTYCYKESLVRLKRVEDDRLSDPFDIPWHIIEDNQLDITLFGRNSRFDIILN
ncbi:F-box domain-containing protein [Citrus sinensis]|nr:F-box domain-containing protein [Citrus sinensis]